MKNHQVFDRQARSFGNNLMNQSTLHSLEPCMPIKSVFNKDAPSLLTKTQSESTMDIEQVLQQKCESEAYSTEIAAYIFSKPSIFITNYFQKQTQINSYMRGVLLNWMTNVHLKYQLAAQTLHMTVHIIDRLLERLEISKKDLQLVGITALWISAKYVEVYQVPKMSNLVYVSDNAYTKKDILDMESLIIKHLQFNLLESSLFTFIQLLISSVNLDEKDRSFAGYFSQLCLIDWGLRTLDQKSLASGIIYLIKRMKKQAPYWDNQLIQLTGISQPIAKAMAKQIYMVLSNIQNRSQFNSLRKKYSSENYHGVGKMIIKHRSE